MLRQIRHYHKWLMMAVSIQVLLWSLTGLYMVSTDIHFIHGESLGQVNEMSLPAQDIKFGVNELISQYPTATEISLQTRNQKPVYTFKLNGKWRVISARNGNPFQPITLSEAKDIAAQFLDAELTVSRTSLLLANPPSEFSARHLPSWQIEFDHWNRPTIYVHQITGEIVTKRHHFWRLFDWMWRLHIMDYDDGENINNMLLTIFSIITIIATILGIVLSYHWFKGRTQRLIK